MGTKGKNSISVVAVAVSAIGGLLLTVGAAQAATTAVGPDRPVTVPPAMFLQPADLGGVVPQPADPELRPALRPPQPCVTGGFASLTDRYAPGAVTAVYPVAEDRPTVLLEDIGLYRGSGARWYMRELRRAVRSCEGCTDSSGIWSVIGRGIAGRDSLLLRLETAVDIEGSVYVHHDYILVARVGKAVVVLADLGWEVGDGHEDLVRSLAPAAVRRARSLR